MWVSAQAQTRERGRKASGTLRERTRLFDKLLNPHS